MNVLLPETADFDAQLAFLTEADKLKRVTRASTLTDQSRNENSAEHSWQAALGAMAWLPDLPVDQLDRVMSMLLIHDLVEIDAGDQPIHETYDPEVTAAAEAAAADRLFAMLPGGQGSRLRALWDEFEGKQSDDAMFAKAIDFAVPVLQTFAANPHRADHLLDTRDNIRNGRARLIADVLPDLHEHLSRELSGTGPVARRSAFVAEADQLKGINRATTLCDGSRPENSAEHSWHLALYALILGEHAPEDVSVSRVMRMLLIHDLVEIDAGDAPLYDQTPESQAAIAIAEDAAAERIFGLLPEDQGPALLSLWQEFEGAETADARFAKALDRFQPPMQNIASGGGSWVTHDVDFDFVDARVGRVIRRSVPQFWDHISPTMAEMIRRARQG